jgi:hypothetical protein
MSWFSSLNNWIGDTVSNAVPNEIKNAIPNEIKPVIDPVGVGGLNENPSIANTLDPLNLSGKRTDTGGSSVPNAVGVGGAAPTYDKTLLDAFNAQLAIQKPLLEANQLYQPQWLALQQQAQNTTAQGQMDLMAKLYPQSGTIEAAYQNQLRQNELQQLQGTLPQYQQAFNALTPGYGQALANTGQLAQQSMQRALQAPQLTNFEGQIGGPSTGYLGQIQQFQPANIAAMAGTPQEAGYFNTVGNAQQVAALAGNVPGMSNLDFTQGPEAAAARAGMVPQDASMQAMQTAAQAGNLAGAVPGNVAMQAAQTAAEAAGSAGAVPTADRMAGVTPATIAAARAGVVPAAEKMSAAQTAARAAALAGPVPTSANTAGMRTVDAALQGVGNVPGAENLAGVAGPQLQSGLENVNQATVDQYLSAMPGMQDYARMLAQQSQAELAAGRGLTAEEQRLADQSVRAAYAARGTALGPQAVGAEILNRADVANQRYQQRLQNAAQAAGTIQSIYQPALAESLQRQQAGLQYGLGAQGQAFGQAQTRDVLAQQQQAQQYAQALGTQTTGFQQAQARDTLNAQLQAQRYGQLAGTQQSGFSQAQAQDAAAQALQAQRYAQAMGTQGASFGQAQDITAMQQALQQQRYAQAMGTQGAGFQQAQAQDVFGQQTQAQRYAQAMGIQGAGFQQAQTRDVFGRDTQAQRYAQEMGTQAAGFGQAQTRDTMAAQLQQQRYNQLTGSQQTAFGQAGTREQAAQQLQQQRYTQALGQQNFLQGAQEQAFNQAMGRENLASTTQQTAFNQALQRGQAEQQRLQAGTAIQAGQAQLGAGAMGQLQNAQAPILNAYYRQPILQQTVGQAQTMGLANQQQAGNTLFQPESPMAFQSAFLPFQSSVAMQQAGMQANATQAAGKNAMTGSIIGAAGAAAAVAICWVAREVYGTETGTWKVFRAWLLEKAPEWLRNAYIKHGSNIADFIKDKPVLKAVIRKWMDSKIKTYLAA